MALFMKSTPFANGLYWVLVYPKRIHPRIFPAKLLNIEPVMTSFVQKHNTVALLISNGDSLSIDVMIAFRRQPYSKDYSEWRKHNIFFGKTNDFG